MQPTRLLAGDDKLVEAIVERFIVLTLALRLRLGISLLVLSLLAPTSLEDARTQPIGEERVRPDALVGRQLQL